MKCNNRSFKMQTAASRRPAGHQGCVRGEEKGGDWEDWRKWFMVWYLSCIMGSSWELLGLHCSEWLPGLDGCLARSRSAQAASATAACCPRLKSLAYHEKRLSENRERGCAHTHIKRKVTWFNIVWQSIQGLAGESERKRGRKISKSF